MEKKRPQLELDELRQLAWLLGGVLGLIAISSLFYLEIDAWLFVTLATVLVPAVLIRPDWAARIPVLVHKSIVPGVVAYAAYDFYTHTEPLASMVRLDVLLLLYRACHYRRRREDLQLIVLGLFLIVMAGVITASLAFAVQIIAFVACALLLLFVVTLVDAQENGKMDGLVVPGVAPAWAKRSWISLFRRMRETCDWRVFALGGVLFAGFVVLSGLLFMAIPRFQLDSGFAFERLISKKNTTGFSDVLKFGDVTDIQQDDSVALRVEASDRNQVPAVLYWRTVVLDEYKNGTFQMSSAMKAAAFQRETTAARLEGFEPPARGRPLYWTFYLEPVVGKYLPLAGGFRRLVFTEPQSFRISMTLRLVMFSREPVAMKAYRVEGMNTDERATDVPRMGLSHAETELRAAMLNTGVGEDDRAVLRKVVTEITHGVALRPEEFSRATMIWLAKQHTYSLKSSVPPGLGDPLVRWLTSNEPGHCELFAAAFALLARTAGCPARVVAGFMGGTWNDDYLIVRNSDAHAWCEIDVGHGQWLRVDPTNDGPRLLAGDQASATASANLRTAQHGWAARFDRLRFLWYRRIVNFDHADQQQLIRTLKNSAEGTGRQIRDWTARAAETLRKWMSQPWGLGRWARVAGATLLGCMVLLVLWRQGKRTWVNWRCVRGKSMDPVRHEAGSWLRRIDGTGIAGDVLAVRGQLEQLRYGRKETWPEPHPIFREAKRACRRKRK